MRLHCKEHGYMDEKTGPMSECPYCEIDRLNKGIKAAYGTLQMFGVPELRAKSVANGIMVLVSRIDKESEFQAQHIARLKEALTPFANYACDPPCGCHNCKAKEALGL